MDTLADRLIGCEPFNTTDTEKKPLFMNAIRESFSHHIKNNEAFRKFCESTQFNINEVSNISDFPFLPVSIFKQGKLASVPNGDIRLILNSSATSGTPSSVPIDAITSKRQSIVSAKVIADYVGGERRPFLIMDEDPSKSSQNRGIPVSARAVATRGFLTFAKTSEYFLLKKGNSFWFDADSFKSALVRHTNSGEPFIIFGFTFLLHHYAVKDFSGSGSKIRLPESTKIIHIGGWKKLQSQSVTKEKFNSDICSVFGVDASNVIDVYGFTEQMGLVYPDCQEGHKHVPLYSEIIIRDFDTLEPVRDGEEGLIQILTPLPHSYPGVSVLTDDVGFVCQRGRCRCGRNGTAFRVVGRAKLSEPRGCGDILSEKMR